VLDVLGRPPGSVEAALGSKSCPTSPRGSPGAATETGRDPANELTAQIARLSLGGDGSCLYADAENGRPHAAGCPTRADADGRRSVGTRRYRAIYRLELSRRRRARAEAGFEDAFALLKELLGDPLNWPERACSEVWRGSGPDRRFVGRRPRGSDLRRLLIKGGDGSADGPGYLQSKERLALTTFLLGNGVSPTIIEDWYRTNASLRDRAAWSGVRALLRGYARGDPRVMRERWYFDLCFGRWCTLDGERKRAQRGLRF
jgi:hypothetical protein